MGIQKTLAVFLGKTIICITRTLKIGGGSAAPGLYALKLYPDLVRQLSKSIPKNIIITGTNGKTTTARLLAHFAKAQGLKVIRNSTGSNLERGVASSLIEHFGQRFDLGIWELDEAAFNKVVPKIKPDAVVFLNAFRDQLDRYGEVDTVIKKWHETLSALPKNTAIFINGDDHNLARLEDRFKGKITTFGVEKNKISGEISGEKSIFQTNSKPIDLIAKDIKMQSLENTTFTLTDKTSVNLPLPGIYNVYNFLASFALAKFLDIPKETILNSLKDFSPAFGRVEKFSFTPRGCKAEKEGYIFLIKNPTGATQVFLTLKDNLKPEDRILLALNDNIADGKDVSWIWDVDFESFRNPSRAQSRDYQFFVSGTRAADMVLRLKYADFPTNSIITTDNLKKCLYQAQNGLKGRLFILPTYTALLSLQGILAKTGVKQHYWRNI